MQESTSWTLLGITALFVILISSTHGCYQTHETGREAIKAGLVEKQNLGHEGYHWDKP